MLDATGSLLQRLLWPKRASFDAICGIYIDYVKNKYPKSTVVFDGYVCGPSTRDNTHLRSSKGKIGAEIHFKSSMLSLSKKKSFWRMPPTSRTLFTCLTINFNNMVVKHSKLQTM